MESFRNFMQERYGFDKLGLFIIIASIVLSMLSRLFWLPLLNWMAIILDIVFIYRFLSKKEFARQRENRIFLEKFEQGYSSAASDVYKRQIITTGAPYAKQNL